MKKNIFKSVFIGIFPVVAFILFPHFMGNDLQKMSYYNLNIIKSFPLLIYTIFMFLLLYILYIDKKWDKSSVITGFILLIIMFLGLLTGVGRDISFFNGFYKNFLLSSMIFINLFLIYLIAIIY